MKKQLFFVALFIGLFSLQSFAQSKTVSGTITDKSGEGLPGVNIILKGTDTGTMSDMNGDYQISVNGKDAQLQFTFIGYKPQTETVGGRSKIDVSLSENVEQLQEVVVVGYGVQKKSSLTGAVSEVGNAKLTQVPTPSLDQALQGRVSGVNVTANTGAPGEGVSVRIRGVGSINSNNDPLYIVDGVPTKDAFNTIAPQDIETVSVLKDAASAAIYGSRANNGVILITTKKGKAGKSSVSFTAETGIQRPSNTLAMANRDQYAEMYNEAARNDNEGVTDPIFMRKLMTPEYIAQHPDVDQQKEIFRQGIMMNYNMNVSGGTDKLTYSVGGNYFRQEGIIHNSDFEKYNGRISLQSHLNDRVKLGLNFNVLRSTQEMVASSGDGLNGGGGSVVRYALFRTPGIPVYDENGDYVDMPKDPNFWGDGYNPVGVANNAYNNKVINQYFGDLNLSIDLGHDLFFSSKLGLDNNSYEQRSFDKTWGTNDRINNPNTLTIFNGRSTTISFSNTLSWDKSIGDHNLNLMAGTEAIDNNGFNNNASQKDFADQDLSLVYMGNGRGEVRAFESKYGYSLLSFFGRANYDYNGKYLASATIRQDGSSRFAPESRWGTFYSGSLGWRLDKEGFMQQFSKLDMLKIRAGYGKIGNQDVGYYAYSDAYGLNVNYPFGGTNTNGLALTTLGNSKIQWESSHQLDLGVDFKFYEGKIHGTVDFFNKVTSDMLTKESIPPSNGNANPSWVNNGSVLNRGIELELGTNQKVGDFTFFADANVTFLHNEVLDLGNPIYGGRIDNGVNITKTEVGYPVGSFFVYEMDGIFQNKSEILTSAFQGKDVKPGDVKFVDRNGDSKIDENDRYHAGSAIPKFTYGLNLGAAYKNWDMNAFFQGAGGHKIYSQINTDIEGFYRPFNVTKRYYDERWTGEGTSNTQPRASWKGKANNTLPSTRFLEDGDYLRLKNIQIGYTFPKATCEKMHISRLRVYASANNLFTITKYSGLDPEMTVSRNSASEGDIAAGIDWGTYPTAKSFVFGVQLGF
ncbi:TonB-dependent receptor [Persicobacter psychrovividus]|uniref:SusC/RagA family TonB-linked outer membrane protein n=1 Tax=Persicobacter psychrovividus TaxID=387638 RepID=A0ABM7VLU2_9BACT|nr:SusC/RagA family TonB-linked outer membrane protein [Persicobacter psychrovividus]